MPPSADMPCPICEDPHPLEQHDLGAQVIYRCQRTGSEFVEDEQTSPTEYQLEEKFTIRRPGADQKVTLPVPSPSVTQRGSVMSYLKHAYAGTGLGELGLALDQPDKYEFGEEVAQGGMGSIRLARDHDLNRQVAIKTLLPKYVASPEFISKFMKEAQLIGQLEHPNIVPVYDVGMQANGEVFFSMKYVRGKTLKEVIEALKSGDPETHRYFTWSRRAQIVQQICEALAFAHGKGVVHRDLKPANIMIGEFGEVQVMDWGVAKKLNQRQAPVELDPEKSELKLSILRPHQTQAGSLVGTVYYMSPEQATGRTDEVTPASDIYSLGAVMYEFFTLQKPHPGENVYEVLASVMRDEPKVMSSAKSPGQGTVPLEIDYICRKAMVKEPAKRCQDVRTIRHELQLFLDGEYPIVCPHTALKRTSSAFSHLIDNHARLVIYGIIATFLVLIAATSVLAFLILTRA